MRRSPTRIGRGIRSSYDLTHVDDATNGDPSGCARVVEIQPPKHCVVDGTTGVLRAVWLSA